MRKNDLEVLYEDNHLIAVNKPSGLLVQEDETGDETLEMMVKEYVRVKYNKPGEAFLGVIHRIDRPVSGLVLFARTSKALERMNKLFAEHQIRKTYWAIVGERPPEDEGELVHWLIKDREKNQTRAYENTVKNGVRAELSYRLLGRLASNFLLEVSPLTGRPHQIRVQLAKMGCPIRGDVKYGFPEAARGARIYLHARQLRFVHPTKKEEITITAPLPRDQVWQMFEGLSQP